MIAAVVHRVLWGPSFPDVIVHGELQARNRHPAFPTAKSGSSQAARAVVHAMLSQDAIARLAALIASRRPLLLAVTAEEALGFNAIPDAMAQVLAVSLGLEAAAGSVVQATKVAHTRADGWHRLATPATFTGAVAPGADYVLVDDHVGFGGTLANQRGFVECQGGHVIGMTTLTETREARSIAVRTETLDVLRARHGQELDGFWRQQFGHGLDCLTNIEAGYLCRAESIAAIKDRMAQAAELARRSGLSPTGIGMKPSRTSQDLQGGWQPSVLPSGVVMFLKHTQPGEGLVQAARTAACPNLR